MEIKTATENYTYEVMANGIATAGATASVDVQGSFSISFSTRDIVGFFADTKSREALIELVNQIADKAENNYNIIKVEQESTVLEEAKTPEVTE